jgi:hypothetical protein
LFFFLSFCICAINDAHEVFDENIKCLRRILLELLYLISEILADLLRRGQQMKVVLVVLYPTWED